MRVRPYYCYQAQLLEGTSHFRVPIERGIELFRARCAAAPAASPSPSFVLDTPYGKVPARSPATLRGRDGDDVRRRVLGWAHLARAQSPSTESPID